MRVFMRAAAYFGPGPGSYRFRPLVPSPGRASFSPSGPLRHQSSSSAKKAANGPSGGPGAQETVQQRNLRYALYATATAVGIVGVSYAAVPLYQIFCQATGYGGTTQQATVEKFKNMKPVPGARQITVHFNADTSSSMPWTFVPQQRSVKVVPGETALAFYTAHNPSDSAVTGVSTYNVTPARAGLYFNKIQCFCFEEQRLRPHEEIDMPIFFYVDPAFLKDPQMENVRSLTLSYTFFRTGEPEVLGIESEYQKREASIQAAKAQLEKIKAEQKEAESKDAGALVPSTAAPVPTTNTGPGITTQHAQDAIKCWTEEVAARTGIKAKAVAKKAEESGKEGAVAATATTAAPAVVAAN